MQKGPKIALIWVFGHFLDLNHYNLIDSNDIRQELVNITIEFEF